MALWTVHGDGRRVAAGEVVAPRERLSWPLTFGFGVQHLLAMFGATVLVPISLGLPVETTLLFSGIGTLIFLLVTRGRVPSFLGSSFAFLAPLTALAEGGTPQSAWFGSIMIVGVLLLLIGLAVKSLGVRLLDAIMPPVVTGGVVVLIGLSLAPVAVRDFLGHRNTLTTEPDTVQIAIGLVTLAVILVCSVLRGLGSRIAVLLGVCAGWAVGALVGGLDAVKTARLAEADWLGLPQFAEVSVQPVAVMTVLPVVIVLVAENVGHVKAVGAVTGRNLDRKVGDSLIGDGLATILAGGGGGSGTTTYAENIGVMAVTRVYSTAAYTVAAFTAIGFSFSPKLGAFIQTIPNGAIGGATLVLFGLIGMIGIRIWIDNKVDFSDRVNFVVVAMVLTVGLGDLTITLGGLTFAGLTWATVGLVVIYPLLRGLSALGRRPVVEP